MPKLPSEIKHQFELEFYITTKDEQDNYKGLKPVLTWLNENQKPMITLNFLLSVDHKTRVQIAILLEKYSLQIMKNFWESSAPNN